MASYVFCASWDIRFSLVLGAATLFNFGAGFLIARSPNRYSLTFGIVPNLGLLIACKYIGLFGLPLSSAILVPVGISYYILCAISYLIDISRKQIEPVTDLLEFALYMAYFPKLVAGPIERAKHFISLRQAPQPITFELISEALWLITTGLFRKIVLADWLAASFSWGQDIDKRGAGYLLGMLLGYAVYLYADFSGYTNIVRGISLLLGIPLSINFRQPYLATSITDFWNRWHISLSQWLRDYLYYPSTRWLLKRTGKRLSFVPRSLPYLLTMLVCGLWHGFALTFVVWGLLHGVYLAVENIFGLTRLRSRNPIWHGIRIGIAFLLVCLAWVFFQASDFMTGLVYLRGLISLQGLTSVHLVRALGLWLAIILLDLPDYFSKQDVAFRQWSPLWRAVVIGVLAVFIILGSSPAPVAFVYRGF